MLAIACQCIPEFGSSGHSRRKRAYCSKIFHPNEASEMPINTDVEARKPTANLNFPRIKQSSASGKTM